MAIILTENVYHMHVYVHKNILIVKMEVYYALEYKTQAEIWVPDSGKL